MIMLSYIKCRVFYGKFWKTVAAQQVVYCGRIKLNHKLIFAKSFNCKKSDKVLDVLLKQYNLRISLKR